MEKQVILNEQLTNFWIEDTGRLYNSKTKRWLKGGINKGYHFYSLFFKGKQYILYTHRAVAEYFLPNPDNLPIVHHIDGNKLNNLYTNLEWVSTEEHSLQHSRKGQIRPKLIHFQENDYSLQDLAQFRDSPYYATLDGEILNMSKKIKIRFEESGNYYRFVGNYNLGRKHFLVHRVVWEAFNGPIPEGCDIDHIDSNPHNNALSNLQAITHKENIQKREFDKSYLSQNLYHGK